MNKLLNIPKTSNEKIEDLGMMLDKFYMYEVENREFEEDSLEADLFSQIQHYLSKRKFIELDNYLSLVDNVSPEYISMSYDLLKDYFPELPNNTFYELGKYIHPIYTLRETETLKEYMLIPPNKDNLTWGEFLDLIPDTDSLISSFEHYNDLDDTPESYEDRFEAYERIFKNTGYFKAKSSVENKIKDLCISNIPINSSVKENYGLKKNDPDFNNILDDLEVSYDHDITQFEDALVYTFEEYFTLLSKAYTGWYEYVLELIMSTVHPICTLKEARTPKEQQIRDEISALVYDLNQQGQRYEYTEGRLVNIFYVIAKMLAKDKFIEIDDYLKSLKKVYAYVNLVYRVEYYLVLHFPRFNTFEELGKSIHPIHTLREAWPDEAWNAGRFTPIPWENKNPSIKSHVRSFLRDVYDMLETYSTPLNDNENLYIGNEDYFELSNQESVFYKKVLDLFKKMKLDDIDAFIAGTIIEDKILEFIANQTEGQIQSFSEIKKLLHPIYSLKEAYRNDFKETDIEALRHLQQKLEWLSYIFGETAQINTMYSNVIKMLKERDFINIDEYLDGLEYDNDPDFDKAKQQIYKNVASHFPRLNKYTFYELGKAIHPIHTLRV